MKIIASITNVFHPCERDNPSGTCRVRFIVDKEGNIRDAEVLIMKGSVLADVAVEALKNLPK